MKSSSVLLSLIVLTVITWLGMLWLVFTLNKQPQIAYVQSVYLVENYKGTKEAYQVLQKKVVQWQANLDSLKSVYQEAITTYNTNKDKLEKEALMALEKDLLFKQQNLEKYQGIVQQKQAEEDQKLTQGVYAQIDSYLKAYAKEQGYDLVIGANAEGTVLYGSEGFDITEEVLDIINQQYAGGN